MDSSFPITKKKIFAVGCRANAKRDRTRAETRIGLSAKRTSPFQSAGGSVQSNTGSRGVWSVDARRLATHSIRIFPLHFPSRASPCAIRSRVSYTFVSYTDDITVANLQLVNLLTPNDTYMGRNAPLTSKRCILYTVLLRLTKIIRSGITFVRFL